MNMDQVYQNTLLAAVINKVENIKKITDQIICDNQIKEKVKIAILLDSVYLFFLSTSRQVKKKKTDGKFNQDAAYSNIAILIIAKIKNILKKHNFIQKEQQTNQLGIAKILSDSFEEEEDYHLYHIINIGTEEEEYYIAVHIGDSTQF
ncbi:hypothetical protein ABPG74_022603 [Tetrahymena malaccensis]